MSQRLDDVTGKELPPLSARQREQQREAMIAQVNAIAREVNAHTAVLREMREWRDWVEGELAAVKAQHELLRVVTLEHTDRSLWARLRWLVTGR